MRLEGGCYCGAVRYVAEGEPMMKGQCHCRECQYISGGSANIFMAIPQAGFRYTQGTPMSFARADLTNPVTRQFCPTCGTQLVTLFPPLAAAIIKVGTLDNPEQFGLPAVAIFTIDKQAFHHIPDAIPAFERMPA